MLRKRFKITQKNMRTKLFINKKNFFILILTRNPYFIGYKTATNIIKKKVAQTPRGHENDAFNAQEDFMGGYKVSKINLEQ